MFRFASPYFFLLLFLVPVLFVYRKRVSMYPAMRMSSTTFLKQFPVPLSVRLSKVLGGLKYLALILFILAAARPQWGTKQISILTEGINIVLAVDVSESMAALDFKKDGKIVNRLEAVRGVIHDFIKKRSGDRIGMVVFGSNAYTQLPLTRDYTAIASIIDRIKIGSAGPSTAVGDAIGISIKRLEDIKSKSNIIILLTDGRSNAGEIAPDSAAEIAFEKSIKVYTIGVGSKGEVPFLVDHPLLGKRYVYQRVDIDEKTLKDIAEKTGAAYFRAQDIRELEKIYDIIDRLEKTEVKVKTYAEYKEYYSYLLVFGMVLLIFWFVLVNTRFMRIP
jgi:Ca-activated chloride channel homolog